MTGVTALPAPVAAAASWDSVLMYCYGNVIGTEEWGKDANGALGPMVNIVRVPQGGRDFEAFGEDPYLAGRMAVPNIAGIQDAGVVATVGWS